MHISVLTLFPPMFAGPFDQSIIKRAVTKKIIFLHIHNIRNFALDTYKSVDDHPYAGGAGMLLKVDVIDRAIAAVKQSIASTHVKTVLLDPKGKPYNQTMARGYSTIDHLILVCGHYEGVDERVRSLVDEEVSIGDYVLTGGEIPAMVIVDSVVRLLPGVLAKPDATVAESFTDNLLEYPQYTRPPKYKGMEVPPIVLSGNHASIQTWKKREARIQTQNKRPDLLRRSNISTGKKDQLSVEH